MGGYILFKFIIEKMLRQKKIVCSFIILSLFIIILIENILAQEIPSPNLPYPLYGYTSFNGQRIDGIKVTAMNYRTGEILYDTSTEGGEYIIELANLKNGYNYGDTIQLNACYGMYCISPFFDIIKGQAFYEMNLDIIISPNMECHDERDINITAEDNHILDSVCYEIVHSETKKIYQQKCYYNISESIFYIHDKVCIDLWSAGSYILYYNVTDISNNTILKNSTFYIKRNGLEDCKKFIYSEEKETLVCEPEESVINNTTINNISNEFYDIKNYIFNLSLPIKITLFGFVGISFTGVIIYFFRNKKKKEEQTSELFI